MKEKVAVVSGGSSGIGKEIALQLRDAGYTVYELSRSGKDSDGVQHISCDVSDQYSALQAVEQVVGKAGQIDLLISNAGMGISGAVEFTGEDDAKRIFDVNFFGTFHLLKAVVPHMRAARGGRILSISSVAADIPIPFQSFYSASKSAISSLTLALRSELKPFGISVAAILPGDIATGFTDARIKDHAGDAAYDGRIERSVALMEKDERHGMSSVYAAKKIVAIARKKKIKPKYTIGIKYKLISVLFKLLPSRFSSYIVGVIYAK